VWVRIAQRGAGWTFALSCELATDEDISRELN